MRTLQYVALMLLAFVLDTLRFWFWSAACHPKLNVAAWLIVILLFNYVGWYSTFWLIGFIVSAVAYIILPVVREYMDFSISILKEQYHGTH
jgi:hypothetical protein